MLVECSGARVHACRVDIVSTFGFCLSEPGKTHRHSRKQHRPIANRPQAASLPYNGAWVLLRSAHPKHECWRAVSGYFAGDFNFFCSSSASLDLTQITSGHFA
jgi:hypothetical protein